MLRLPEYLNSQGIHLDSNGFALCPLHDDKKSKSFHLITSSGSKIWHCFGCGQSGSIFTLANQLEGLPMKGAEFHEITLPTLAKRMGLKYVPKAISQADSNKGQLRELFNFIRKELVIDERVQKFAENRALPENILKRFGIGRVTDYVQLKRKLSRNFGDDILKKAAVLHDELFVDRILFTLFDDFGSPIGFAGRIDVDTPETPRAKYVNSITNPFYDKSKHLYNMHFAKKFDDVFVVEGQIDTLRLVISGMQNVVAVGGSALTDDHIRQLAKFKKITLALDGDAAGLTKMDKIRERLKNSTCILIPDGMDPDSYVRNYGVDSFKRLDELDDLSWQIVRDEYYQPAKSAEGYVQKIADSSPIYHTDYLRRLAKASGVEYFRLKDGLNAILNERAWDKFNTIMKSKDKIGSLSVQVSLNKQE